MRTLNELYLLLWEYIKDMESLDDGICNFILWMHVHSHKNFRISEEEYKLLIHHLKQNKPPQKEYRAWWFPDGEKGTKQRKEFVLSMIEKTKQQ